MHNVPKAGHDGKFNEFNSTYFIPYENEKRNGVLKDE